MEASINTKLGFWRAAKIAGLAAGLIVTTAGLFLFDPRSVGFYPRCPLHTLTGLYCPGCGSSRALHQLLHGNLAAAFRFNPLLVLSLPFLCYFYFRPRILYRPSVAWLAFSVVVLYGICRNLPLWPFTLLAPS